MPFDFNSNDLQKLYAKFYFVPFLLSILVLILWMKNRKNIKVKVIITSLLTFFYIIVSLSEIPQWYDAVTFGKSAKNPQNTTIVFQILEYGGIQEGVAYHSNTRLVKKEIFLKYFCKIEHIDTTGIKQNKEWITSFR